ncbi:MAG: hypothetical protein IPK26_04305 [Planctomycetes bacterium]|nr:hypothetical protein [Planctomycetota bacterium]
MLRPFALFLPLALTAPLFAQAIEIKAGGDDQTLDVAIKSTLTSNVTTKTLINGEEGGFGGGGGGRGPGGGETTTTQDVAFKQGPAKDNWREYTKLIAKDTRMGQDGTPRDTEVTGALQGKKLALKMADTGLSLTEGEGDKATTVSPQLAANVPGRLALAGLLPSKAVAVGQEFEIAAFAPALRSLLHPVTAERPQGGGRGQGGGEGGGQGGGRRGGQGGEEGGGQGEGGGRGRGQGGGQGGAAGGRAGGRMGGGGASGTVMQLLSGGKLEGKATGKLTAIEEKDGQKIAVLAISAKLTGKGKAADLGVRGGGMFGGGAGGRRGQGGEGGGQAATDNGVDNIDTTFDLTGTVRVNLTAQQICDVSVGGDIVIGRETKRTMPGRDGGDGMEVESTSTTKAKLQLDATCAVAK